MKKSKFYWWTILIVLRTETEVWMNKLEKDKPMATVLTWIKMKKQNDEKKTTCSK